MGANNVDTLQSISAYLFPKDVESSTCYNQKHQGGTDELALDSIATAAAAAKRRFTSSVDQEGRELHCHWVFAGTLQYLRQEQNTKPSRGDANRSMQKLTSSLQSNESP